MTPYTIECVPVASSVVTLGPALPGPPAGDGTGVLEAAGERAMMLGTGRSVDLIWKSAFQNGEEGLKTSGSS